MGEYKSIWCLFSIDNNYDQPKNNLVAWWGDKPSHALLKEAIDTTDDVMAGMVLRGLPTRGHYLTEYRLEQVAEGKLNS